MLRAALPRDDGRWRDAHAAVASRWRVWTGAQYYVMRALHKQEENEAVRDSIEGVVNLMVRDDDPRDAAADGGDDEAITMV